MFTLIFMKLHRRCTQKKRKTLERTSCSAVVRARCVVIPDELLRNKFERARKMAGLSVTENIDSIETCELKNLLLHLFTKLSAKDEKNWPLKVE